VEKRKTMQENKRNVIVEFGYDADGDEYFLVRGNTYPLRDVFRSLGLGWRAYKLEWGAPISLLRDKTGTDWKKIKEMVVKIVDAAERRKIPISILIEVPVVWAGVPKPPFEAFPREKHSYNDLINELNRWFERAEESLKR